MEADYDSSHRAEWLGGEAQVQFQAGLRDRRNRWRTRDGGFAALALALAFTAGMLLGTGVMWLAERREAGPEA